MGLLYNHAGYLAIAAIYAIAISHCPLKSMYVCVDEDQAAIRIISNPAWLRSLTLAKTYVVCLYKSPASRCTAICNCRQLPSYFWFANYMTMHNRSFCMDSCPRARPQVAAATETCFKLLLKCRTFVIHHLAQLGT